MKKKKTNKRKEDRTEWANFSSWAGRKFSELHSARWSYLYSSHKSLFSSTFDNLQDLKHDAAMENKDFLQVSELPAHHSHVLPPELEQTQVIKALNSCRNCPWLKTHGYRKTNCQCRQKKQPFVPIEFTSAQVSREVQHWFWLWIFIFSKKHVIVKSLPPFPSEICSLYLLALSS